MADRKQRAKRWFSPALLGVVLASSGCTGQIGGGDSSHALGAPSGPGASVPGVSGSAGASAAAPSAAAVADGSAFFPGATQQATKARIWQLTAEQYITTISDALGVPIALPSLLPTTRDDLFENDANALEISEVYFADLEEGLRAELLTHQDAITARLSCTVAALNADCAKTLLTSMAAVAQGLATPSVDSALQVFTTLAPQAGARAALDDAILALLMSPSVLFRTELGPQAVSPTTTVSLTPAELSKSLAYAITNGPPDDTLRARAADGSLAQPNVFAAELKRLQASPRGRDGVKGFLLDWLGMAGYRGLEKDPFVFPEFTDPLKQSMLQETQSFIDYILGQRSGNFVDLMTSQQSFVSADEASLYGLTATAPAGQLTLLPPGQRMGIFTQPAVLSAISDSSLSGVIYRGKFMVERLLCMTLARPTDIVVEFPDFAALGLAPDASVRERLSTIEGMAACAPCHKLMHPPGFALEIYDAIGRYRTEDLGKPIDASGALTFTNFTKAPFTDATQMFKTMADSPEVQACVTRQAFRYVFGRYPTGTDDPVLIEPYRQFAASKDVGALLPQLASSTAFALRERAAQ